MTEAMLPAGRVIDEFRQRRKRQWIASVPAIVSLLVFVFWPRDNPGSLGRLVVIGAVAVVVAYFLFSIYNWRCPSCERYLGRNMNPADCPKCGVQLTA